MGIDKYHLSLAGEYRVCSELLRRGIFATVTFGNMKGVDVVAVGTNRRAAIIEVKTSQKKKRIVTGFFQKYRTEKQEHPTFWVLCSIVDDQPSSNERFFVLRHAELAEIQARTNKFGNPFSWDEVASRCAKGVDNVAIKDLEAHVNQWEKIVAWCNEETG